ncbi:PH domain-containing protein [Amphibacillus sp. MSJ-3]|uniref:PH domain-containing protein n=1 Tax=Amphibacillus sp. MSJ-3 TaxID=2841505 RepID=UPI001C0E9A83|nr:PH domain-containing protein [Amphibacillus sp. MSJ-3]MBU5594903.1 PH domain-containing protein [Amphibacillus sp. MSJ-3]
MSEEIILEFESDLFGIKDNSEGPLKIPKEYYTLTTERLKVRKQGVMTKTLSDIEVFKINDITVKQKLTDKVRGVGDIEILSADESDPKLILKKVKDPHEVREQIRDAAKKAKEKMGVKYRYEL